MSVPHDPTALRSALLELVEEANKALCNGHHDLPAAIDRAQALVKGTRREFFVVVTGQDAGDDFLAQHPDMTPLGPIVWETYLEHATHANALLSASRLARTHKWARVAHLIVEDWPEEAKA